MVVFPNGVTEFRLVGENVTPISVQGSAFRLVNGTLFFSPNASQIAYVANFSSGVIEVQEPYNVTAYLILPFNYSLVYVSPSPSAVLSKGNVYAVLTSTPYIGSTSQARGQGSGPVLLVELLALGLLVSNSVLAGHW